MSCNPPARPVGTTSIFFSQEVIEREKRLALEEKEVESCEEDAMRILEQVMEDRRSLGLRRPTTDSIRISKIAS